MKAHRQTYFDYTWVNYNELTTEALRLIPPTSRLSEWRADYEAMRAMFFGVPPGFEEIMEDIHSIEEALSRL